MGLSISDRRTLLEELGRALPSGSIRDGDLYRAVYARDASYFEMVPEAVVRVRSVEEVVELLGVCRRRGVPVTFRAAGTSLSGQSVGSGVIAELKADFRALKVLEDGRMVQFEPGLTVSQVNDSLRPFGRKIGPDPASKSVAMMGGVLANNSSGMQAGVEENCYSTLRSMEFVLANGNRYDSGCDDDRQRFHAVETAICAELGRLKEAVWSNEPLVKAIRRKYSIKNVTGYSINAFVDFEDPIDILVHLMIGSEGTLGFVASAVLATVPLLAYQRSCLLVFEDIVGATRAVEPLTAVGATAIELMDRASLRSVASRVGVPGFVAGLPGAATALLVDLGADDEGSLQEAIGRFETTLLDHAIVARTYFTISDLERSQIWTVRDGIFSSVGGDRRPGSSIILEDVAVPPARLADLVMGLGRLFDLHGYQGAIFGHAKAGNMHFLVADDMSDPKRLSQFATFMSDVVDLVLELDGSLKAEHGTGRAMTAFVEREWGEAAYSIMVDVKRLLDPLCILNPGVVIDDDPSAHLSNIKAMAILGDSKIDSCVECGFCEPICPTRYVTLTPRQRIAARRVLEGPNSEHRGLSLSRVQDEYRYGGVSTCVSDGLCSTVCPMQINTAALIEHDREANRSQLGGRLSAGLASNFAASEVAMRLAIGVGVKANRALGSARVTALASVASKALPHLPAWSSNIAFPPRRLWHSPIDPSVVYFPSCVSRVLGGSISGKPSIMQTVVSLGEKAKSPVLLPKDANGLCCSQIWAHTGDPLGRATMANRVVEAMWRWSEGGRVPIMCDTASCTLTLIRGLRMTDFGEAEEVLSPQNLARHSRLRIMDLVDWLGDLLPRLNTVTPKESVLIHPTCACRVMGSDSKIGELGGHFAEEVVIPKSSGCCGGGGNRGFLYPEVTESALRDERDELANQSFSGAYSFAKTCEIVLSDRLGTGFESIAYLADETTK